MTAKIDLHTSTGDQLAHRAVPVADDDHLAGHGRRPTTSSTSSPSSSSVRTTSPSATAAAMTTTLQFYVLEPIDAALQRHATFMVANQQWTTGDLKGAVRRLDDGQQGQARRRGRRRLGRRLGLDARRVPGREERPDAGRLRGDRARHLPRRRLGARDRQHLVHRPGLVVPGRDQRREHHELLLRPRLRLPARVQHLLLDVQDRQPVPEAGHLPPDAPTPTCCARTTSSTRSTRGTATRAPGTWASRRCPTSRRR